MRQRCWAGVREASLSRGCGLDDEGVLRQGELGESEEQNQGQCDLHKELCGFLPGPLPQLPLILPLFQAANDKPPLPRSQPLRGGGSFLSASKHLGPRARNPGSLHCHIL